MRSAAIVSALALLALGCEYAIPSGRYVCIATADCPPGFRCEEGLCVEGLLDAAAADGGGDAGTDGGEDAGARDAGADAAVPDDDAGAGDAGMDGGGVDAGGADAGTDAGGADAGGVDGGTDAGSADAGVDGASPDAGPLCGWGVFDGASHVEVTGFGIADVAHTTEAWVRLTPGDRPIVSFGRLTFTARDVGDLIVQYTAHNAVFAPSSMLGVVTRTGAWHHVAYTYDGGGYTNAGSWRFWVDGVAYAADRFEGNASRNPLPTSGAVTVGREPTETTPAFRYLQGDLRELRVSMGVRYSAPFTPSVDLAADASTLALWRLGDLAAGVAPDSSSGGHPGVSMGVTAASGSCP